MTKKLLFRHTNTTQSLTGFARRAVILLAVLCYVGGTWGQTLVRKGTINSQDDVAIYNQMMAECPVDITSQLGALTTWTGDNITHVGKSGQHWDGTTGDGASTYSENNQGWDRDSWSASMTKTITLPKGKYLFIGPGRSQQNVEVYFKVGNLSARVHNGGDTGLGINTSGQPSFNSSDNFANGNAGRGWRYTYIQFDVAYESNVTFKIDANATGRQQFMSFTDPRLYKLSENLRTDMYMAWDGVGGNASATGNTGCENNFNSSANNIYGDANVSNTHYADLTDYSTLELTFSEGTPRLLFNRQTTDNNNDNNSNWLEINSANPINGIQYVTVDGNRWIIDLDKVANDRNLGYVHLNSIKGANWQNVTITSATLSGPSLRSLFHQWDGTGAGSSVKAVNPENFVWHNGEEVAAGGVIYGDNSGWVPQNQYADLTPYDKLVVTYDNSRQYPRFMFNKAGDNTFVVEVNGQNSGYVSVDGNQITINLAKLRNDQGGYVHLNGIKASNGGTTTISAINLLSFNPSTNINQRVEKTFNISDGNVLFQNPREFTVQFNFDAGDGLEGFTLYLYNNGQQVASLPIEHGEGSGPEGYWWQWDRFHGHTLQSGDFYVRWYLKDKSGNVKNIDNSLINSIYGQTVTSQDGVVWSSRAGDYKTIKDLHTILRMTVDGTPDGGEPFNLLNYDLVCAISDAGNESVINNTAASDPSPINIEYTFHFAMEKISLTDKKVTHKISYLKQYADQYSGLDLELQGLTTDAQSDWWNYGKETQKVNQFEITHYVKKGESETYLLPTAQNTNDHTMYQRWYNYNDETDLQGIQSHVTLNGNGGSVPYYIYQNGLVTGDGVYWGENRSFLSNGQTPYAYTTFTYQNVDGDSLTVAADVSRYSDMTYDYPNDPLSGNLEEPSLTMRYIYYMKDAREMAAQLTKKTFQGVWSSTQYEDVNQQQNSDNTNEDNWLEKKVFHFPSRQLAYEKDKAVGYRGEFIALRHRFSDYWIFNGSAPTYDSEHPTNNDNLNDYLIHGSTYGSIVVKIFDPNGTGIRLGGYNPSINLKNATAWETPQVGDIIRVYTRDRAQNANLGVLFKHMDASDWDEFIGNGNMVPTNNYVEARILNEDVLNELKSSGLRFQGTGFTITSVDLISQVNGAATPIYNGDPVVFPTGNDGWNVYFTIDSGQFSLRPVNNNEGNNDDYQGFYYHDKMYPWGDVDEYGSSRFLVFRYPESGQVTATNKEVYLRAYFVDPNDHSRIFQLAQYTLIFDEGAYGDGCATLPLRSVNGGTNVKVSGSEDQYSRMDYVEGTPRDPNMLRARAGKPIAQITFDYPEGSTYHFPVGAATNHGQNRHEGESYGYSNNQPYIYPDDDHPLFTGIIPDSSPIPLNFDKSNYAFDGENALFGAYAMLGGMNTRWGNQKECLPADDATYGYNLPADDGYDAGFLYIDASELPGDICSTPFVGNFCAGDHLMVSGWISGANNVKNGTGVPRDGGGDGVRSPGGITLTLKGERNVHNPDGTIMYDENGNPKKETKTLYRFCPGMCYELDNGGGVDGSQGSNVMWQQFYFEFEVGEKYDRHWLEVNNNCVSSQGGDFMLDNIEVYCYVPEVEPTVNTPLCVSVGEDGETVTDMRLLKIIVDHNKLKSSKKLTSGTAEMGFVFLDKYKFLEEFLKGLKTGYPGGLRGLDFNTITLDKLSDALLDGILDGMNEQDNTLFYPIYKDAFDAAVLGNPVQDSSNNWHIWHSDSPGDNMNSSVMYFRWSATFGDGYMPPYSYADAVNKKKAVFSEVIDGENYVVMNGNFPGLKWKTNTEYYIIPTNATLSDVGSVYLAFDLCSNCSKASTFLIEPPLEVVGLDAVENMEDLVVCDGQVPTLLTNLKGYDINGNEIKMKNLNFDWWLGKKGDKTTTPETPPVPATLDNYHAQYKLINESLGDVDGNRIYLAYALSVMRAYYPGITSLDAIMEHESETPHLEKYMIEYLREVVDAGELLLHQSAISVPAEQVLDSDPYFYLVACPIHDEAFIQALNPSASEYVAFYCDEPQGVRIKLGQKAPRLQTGFVPGEHGFASYNYDFPANTNPVLSIRLAKAAQFETVKEQSPATDGTIREDVNYLWLPIRNAQTEGAGGVIKKSEDDNVYLAASNDLTWDKKVSTEMNKNGSLPVVGRIVQLKAINTKDNSEGALPGATIAANENDNNRLCVYFNNGFNVREGYNYTLSLPFQEDDNSNACDGTILINLKIVPDYEVWTGAAGNTDWNNDENWRRADGNTGSNLQYDVYGDELYRANGAANNPNSPLYKYTTNKDNYYSSATSKRKPSVDPKPSSDQVLRKGFAPLYCTHILMSRDEWGNAPILYDALDNQATLTASPFPNLRETSTPILKFDMQARRYDMWKDTYGVDPDRGVSTRTNDLIAEMYQINSCDEIAMQPGTELRNAHLLNYNNAWMEFELDAKRWYLLGSPLQGTISGEWYAPTGTDATGNAPLQKTTYYDDVKFGAGYDRYSPAIYQRSWDKAKAVLYEVGSTYDKDDDKQDENLGNDDEGIWSGTGNSATWAVEGGGSAEQYLDRLGYKPMGGKKANVAIKGIWSNTYNDAQVDYSKGGFSVMVLNHLKENKPADVKAIVRLPKEDTMYDYYEYSQNGADDGGTDTDLSTVQSEKNRALNRGRLKADLLLPEIKDGNDKKIIQKIEKTASRYGDTRTYTRIPINEADLNTMNSGTFSFTEEVASGVSNLGYYLVENPLTCGLDMAKFLNENSDKLESKYWILTATGQHLVQQVANDDWVTSDGATVGAYIEYPDPSSTTESPKPNLKFYPDAVVAPGQGFFVQAKEGTSGDLSIKFTKEMQVQSRFGVIDGEGTTYKIVVGQAQETKKMYDAPGDDGTYDGMPDADLPAEVADNYEAGDTYMVGDVETIVYVVNQYEDIDDPDNPGQTIQIPKLKDLEEDVVIYKYKQETLSVPDDPSTDEVDESKTINKEYPLKGRTRGGVANLAGLVITAQRGSDKTSALVMQRENASDDFLPSEDTEVFITSDFESVPTVYTLCGRLATTINSIHEFHSLPLGVESNSDAPCVLTFKGVEALGDSVAFYDALEQTLTPLESGMTVSVSGQTQNRYYLVRSLSKEEAAAETHIQIFTEGLTARVIASTAEPIVSIRCYDTAGRLIHSASPQSAEYGFTLPVAGVYIIDAETANDRKTKKLMAR